MNTSPDTAVLLAAFGGPRRPEEVGEFLRGVGRGRIPEDRIREVAAHYARVGGSSPLYAQTLRQAELLRKSMIEAGVSQPVYVGMLNWHPFLTETLAKMAVDGVRRIAVLVLAPHRCEFSLRRYREAIRSALAPYGPTAPEVDYVAPWHDHPLFVEAVAARIREAVLDFPSGRRDEAAWVFTAHSIPLASEGAEIYRSDLSRTIELVCERLGRRQWMTSFQSRSGGPFDAWLEPDLHETLRSLASLGRREVLFIPVGFVSDHVEVLYDLDVDAAAQARNYGLHAVRAKTVGEHPAFLSMMRECVLESLRETNRSRR